MDFREDAEEQLKRALTSINKQPEGVYVQASTLGSLEALLEFLTTQKIPVSSHQCVFICCVRDNVLLVSVLRSEHRPSA
jgi:translation initiation factor IF-2